MEHEEAKMREQQKASANALQAKLKRELEPSRLGKALSDTLTRTLIISVLLLLMVLPAIQYQSEDSSIGYGLRQVFWFGRSNCNEIKGEFYCEDRIDWVTHEGWQSLLRGFVKTTSPSFEDEGVKSVLWMYVPDYDKQGLMSEIKNITT